MNVLHLANHCRLGHGNVHLAVDLACIQKARGDRVFYAGEDGELRDILGKAGVVFLPLRQRTRQLFTLLSAMATIRRLINRHEIDIVHAHMMSGALLGFGASRFTRARLVTTVHNSFDWHSRLMRLGDRIAAVSEAERQALIARGFSPQKLVAILNATLGGARAHAFADASPIPVENPSIVTVCGLHRRKDVQTVIDAFYRVSPRFPVHLHIVGDGPDREALQQQAIDLGLADRIHFHGSLRNPARVLEKADIFVLASRAEPLGLANIEAREAGCAIVASEVGGIPEALDFGAAGILVPPGNPDAFAVAIAALLEDPRHLGVMKTRARANLERFSIDRLYRNYRDLYRSLAGTRTDDEKAA